MIYNRYYAIRQTIIRHEKRTLHYRSSDMGFLFLNFIIPPWNIAAVMNITNFFGLFCSFSGKMLITTVYYPSSFLILYNIYLLSSRGKFIHQENRYDRESASKV